ncbi:MAG: tetratricopeptide repeat protein [Spirochaetota bacterium]|nr:tetratricopeptide repeat protein [Spirochaetota bacterium]
MEKRKIRVSTKYVIGIAILYSLLIIISSLLLHFALKSNLNLLKEIVKKNNDKYIIEIVRMINNRLKEDKITKIDILPFKLNRYCSKNEDFLYAIIFQQSEDENYFQIIKKISLNPSFKIKTPRKKNIQEEKEMNYLKKGKFREIIDPNIYSSNGIYWQNVYTPFKIGGKTYIIEFTISTSDVFSTLNKYYKVSQKTKKYILIILIITIIIVFILTFLFTHNFTLFLKNLSRYMNKASSGNIDLNLNPINDEDFSELALSFNSLLDKLRESKEKDKIIQELENYDPLSEFFKNGVNFLKENRIDEAISFFHSLSILKPDGFANYFNLGVAFAKKKDYENSLEMFNKALEIYPDHELTENYILKVQKLQKQNEKPVQ